MVYSLSTVAGMFLFLFIVNRYLLDPHMLQVILEGMGRALHTNFKAKFKCDCLKVSFFCLLVVGLGLYRQTILAPLCFWELYLGLNFGPWIGVVSFLTNLYIVNIQSHSRYIGIEKQNSGSRRQHSWTRK